MSATVKHTIEVWADWVGLNGAQHLGTLDTTLVRDKEIFSFEYDREWLRNSPDQNIDPSLQHYTGPQYLSGGRSNFGLFLDSAPDRWGRFLMDRQARQAEREEGRPRQTLRESDYLSGVFDEQRMGALRFRLSPDGPFLDNNQAYASPPWTSLRELEQASQALEQPDAEKSPYYQKWLRMSIAPGGSLGGAHPKAGVMDPQGQLWIAKFPKRGEATDGGGWEFVVHILAQQAGVEVPEAQARTFNTSRHTFLARRFDRVGAGRIHFASAMTLLNRSDADDASNGTSYLELAELLMKQGARPDFDLEQLWRRIVFSICVSNVDDHLRNHGFLLTPQGWTLSPGYDINPDPNADGLKLNISDAENAQDLGLAREVADFFRIKAPRASEIIDDVVSAVRPWRDEARKLGLSSDELARMEPAFRVAGL